MSRRSSHTAGGAANKATRMRHFTNTPPDHAKLSCEPVVRSKPLDDSETPTPKNSRCDPCTWPFRCVIIITPSRFPAGEVVHHRAGRPCKPRVSPTLTAEKLEQISTKLLPPQLNMIKSHVFRLRSIIRTEKNERAHEPASSRDRHRFISMSSPIRTGSILRYGLGLPRMTPLQLQLQSLLENSQQAPVSWKEKRPWHACSRWHPAVLPSLLLPVAHCAARPCHYSWAIPDGPIIPPARIPQVRSPAPACPVVVPSALGRRVPRFRHSLLRLNSA